MLTEHVGNLSRLMCVGYGKTIAAVRSMRSGFESWLCQPQGPPVKPLDLLKPRKTLIISDGEDRIRTSSFFCTVMRSEPGNVCEGAQQTVKVLHEHELSFTQRV